MFSWRERDRKIVVYRAWWIEFTLVNKYIWFYFSKYQYILISWSKEKISDAILWMELNYRYKVMAWNGFCDGKIGCFILLTNIHKLQICYIMEADIYKFMKVKLIYHTLQWHCFNTSGVIYHYRGSVKDGRENVHHKIYTIIDDMAGIVEL